MHKVTRAINLMEKAMALLEQAKAEHQDISAQKGPKPSSGIKGVVRDKRTGRWGARAWVNGKSVWVGTYDTADAAKVAIEAIDAQ